MIFQIFPEMQLISVILAVVLLTGISTAAPEIPYTDVQVGDTLIVPPIAEESFGAAKVGASALFFRLRVPGVSRVKGWHKLAETWHVNVRNGSLPLVHCDKDAWRLVDRKEGWTDDMSPYETVFLDIKASGPLPPSSLNVTVSGEAKTYLYILLAAGLTLFVMAPLVSSWVPFYYSSGIALGILLVLLVVLFQVMKMLPTSRRSTLHVFMYGTLAGVSSIVRSYIYRGAATFLHQLGYGDDLVNPLVYLMLAVVVLLGAALGVFSVRKFVLSTTGEVDEGTAKFVLWALRFRCCDACSGYCGPAYLFAAGAVWSKPELQCCKHLAYAQHCRGRSLSVPASTLARISHPAGWAIYFAPHTSAASCPALGAVDSHDFIVVEFYAPWCGHCKNLAPEYEKAAAVLKTNDPPITLAKVDGNEDQNKELLQEHEVGGFPTLKIFRNKGLQSEEYKRPRDAEGIIEYLKKQAGPVSEELKTAEEAKAFIDSAPVTIVGLFESFEGDDYSRFIIAAESVRSEFVFAHTKDASHLPGDLKAPAVGLFKKFDEGFVSTKDFALEALTAFLEEESLPLVIEMNKDPAQHPFLLRFFNNPDSKIFFINNIEEYKIGVW